MSYDTGTSAKTIEVRYFAVLRELRGLDKELVRTNAATAADLFAELRKQHSFPFSADVLRVAIDDTLCDWHTPLVNGSRVVFLSPVSGG